MALNANDECVACALDGFDDPIGRASDHTQTWRDIPQRLVVQRIDRNRGCSQLFRQPRSAVKFQRMRQIRPIAALRRRAMVECSRQFIADILVECTAERDVDQLNAATDRKHRFVIGDSPPRQ